MNRFYVFALTLFVSVTAALIPIVMARPTGAPTGFSGGPATLGSNCTICHGLNLGTGSVVLQGLPRRYRPGVIYDLTVRIADDDQVSGGFQISVEDVAGYLGSLILSDPASPARTKFSDASAYYLTHTIDGYDASLAAWASNGNSFSYDLQWQAPAYDAGDVTFFLSAMAGNNSDGVSGDKYYDHRSTIVYAQPGDADGDTDRDLSDFAVLQRCFDTSVIEGNGICEYVDADDDALVTIVDTDAFVTVMDGPTAMLPGEFVTADLARGALLYDKWWLVNGSAEPTGDHPLYPGLGQKSGATTFRCKECHGWDYKGASGVYGSGSHFTGIAGVYQTTRSPKAVFDLLKADPNVVAYGHHMNAFGMSDQDIWDAVRFVFDGVVDTDMYYLPSVQIWLGNAGNGQSDFDNRCMSCHGTDGTDLNFGTALDPEYVGTVASDNPWEFLHKIRFGHPGRPMPAQHLLGLTRLELASLGAHAATLPTQ